MGVAMVEYAKFVMNTGRCGSTLLTNMFREHPDLLSLSECLGNVVDFEDNATRQFDGRTYWSVLDRPNPHATLLSRHGLLPDKTLYPKAVASIAGMTARETIPPLLLVTYPALTDQFEELYNETREFVYSLRPSTFGQMTLSLFEWLCWRFGRSQWIERSGASLSVASGYRGAFRNARFVHLVRDGRDCALSMSKHANFRLRMIERAVMRTLGKSMYDNLTEEECSELAPELRQLTPARFDKHAFEHLQIPLRHFGSYWSELVTTGPPALGDAELLTVSYEDLIARPRDTLAWIAHFLDIDVSVGDWLDRAVSQVKPSNGGKWRSLSPEERAELEEACRPGLEFMGYA